MAKHDIRVNIIADDNASSVFRNIRANASSMSSSLMGALGGAANFMGGLDAGLRRYNASMYRFNRVVGSVVRTAGDSIYNFTKDAINNFSELERQHAKTMGAMATEYDKTADAQRKFLDDSAKLKQQALTLGTFGPTGAGSLNTVTDVSYAQTALVKAGLSADDLLGTDAIESILKFAGGNDLSIDAATQFAVNLGTVFDKPVDQWSTMLDMVTKAADISVIDVEDIMDSLTYTGGIASGLGRDLEEVLGVISVMGQSGLRGRVAGTGMQAFFTRILSAGELSDTAIDNAPSDYVGQMYNAFIGEAVNADGSFKEMDEVAELLDTAMSELDDQEQAWFAKKLFGLYQMKAAYALTGAVDEDGNVITDFIDQIENQSEGTNDGKYDIMLESQYGKLERITNAWEGIKTDFGDRLSPVVETIGDELFNFLKDPNNYEINWDNLRTAISTSGGLISEKYGEELGRAVENIGNFGIDTALITEALIPTAGGLVSGLTKLFNGDISGALEDFSEGINATNTNIDGLPEDLQDTATAAHNAFNALTILAGVNLATQILQPIVTAINTLLLKPIKWIVGKVTSTSTTVSSPNSVVNANYVSVNTSTTSVQAGTATAVNIGQVPLMNVTATVVNVYGGSGLNPNGGLPTTTPPLLPSGGTPLLPSGGGLLLPGATAAIGTGAGYMIGSGGKLLLPGMTGSTPLLPGAGGTTTGGIVNVYKFGGKYMTAHDIIAQIGKTAGKGLSIAAILGFAKMNASPGLFKSEDKRVQDGSDWLDRYVAEGNTDYDTIAGNARVYDWTREQSNYTGNNNQEIVEAEMRGRTAAREEMMSYYKSGEGAAFLSDLFAAQIEANGKITEDFLSAITTWEKDGYTYTGSNEDIKSILDFMYSNFGDDYDGDNSWLGRFNDSAINDFLQNSPVLNESVSAAVAETSESIGSAVESAVGSLGSMMDRVNSPNITVNVTTNVDKSGNATSNVDINSIAKDVSRRGSQYGQTNMIN